MLRLLFLAHAAFACLAAASEISASPFDWPQWRGPHRNGISDETDWSAAWPASGPKVLWRASVGTGYATVSVSRGRVYTLGNDKAEDTLWCLDASTGTPVWKHSFKSELEPNSHAGGPGSTPAVDGKLVYAMSKHGQIFCLDAQSGDVKWSKQAGADFGAPKPQWAFASSPLIVGDTLLLNAVGGGLALNKTTGDLLWKGAGTSAYASPVLFQSKSGPAAAFFGKEALFGVRIGDGKVLWEFPWKTNFGENSPDPIVDGNTLYLSTGHGLGAALLKIPEEGTPAPVWENKTIGNHISSGVLKDGYLYSFTGLVHRKMPTNLSCVDFKTGQVKWSQPDLLGQLILAGNKLLMLSTEGELIVAEASPEKYVELARAKVLDSKPGEGKTPPKKCWTVPVLSNARIYCRNASGDLVCLDVSK